MLKKLFSHTAIYGLAPQVTKVASFFSLPFITRDLTGVDYGVSGVLNAYTGAISVLAALGLRVVLVNSFFKSSGHFKWVWRQIYGFLTLWNFIYALILSAIIYYIIPKEAEANRWLIIALNGAPLVFFGQTSTICTTYYQLNQKPLQIAIRSVIFGILTIGLNLLFITKYKMGYMGWFWSSFIVGILSNVSFYYPLNYILKIKPIFNYKWRLIKNSLRVSLPMIPHYYSSYLLDNSDKMVMDMLGTTTQLIGKYNVANTVGRFTNSLGTASGLAVGPLLNKYYKEKNDEAAKLLIYVLQIAFFIITFGLCLFMKEIFSFLIRNDDLAQMYPLGILIVMAYNYRPMYFGANSKLMFYEKTNVLWKVTFGAGIINVFLNFAFIPWFGFEVAAMTTWISYMFMGYIGYYFKVYKSITEVKYNPLRWLVTTLILTICAYYCVELPVIIKVVIASVTTLVGVIWILKLNKRLDGF